MICPACQTQNPENAKFCVGCAAVMALHCTACGATYPIGSKFCGQCGAPVVIAPACRTCNQSISPGHKFCGNCGTPVAQAPAQPPIPPAAPGETPSDASPHPAAVPDLLPPANGTPAVSPVADRSAQMLASLRSLMPATLTEKISAAAPQITGERREVTVLFLKVVTLSAGDSQMDSEDLYLLTDQAMRRLVEIIYKYEATVDKFTGDGLMALFGAPVAHENDPERAVRATIELHAALEPLRQQILDEHGIELKLRIGINTGLVIAGSLGSSLHMEYTVIGDTVNTAARLESVAETGTTLVSFSTYQRTRPLFNYVVLPPIRVKGKPEPIRSFRPLGVRQNPGQVRGLPGLQVPMVGRREKLAELEAALMRMTQKRESQIALVSGEAGLGKSRLVAEFRQRIANRYVTVHEGSCLAYARSTPLWLVASLLRDICQIREIDSEERQRGRIRECLMAHALSLPEFEPYIADVLGLDPTGSALEVNLKTMDPTVLERQTHAALHQLLRAEATKEPKVIVLEDVHWIDPASRTFLIEFLRLSTDLPIFFILVTREYERKTVLANLLAAMEKLPGWQVDLPLTALTAAEENQLIHQLLSQADIAAPRLAKRIAQRAEGNPFYVEEIVRMLVDQSRNRDNEDDTLTSDDRSDNRRGDEILDAIPGTLKGLILARFDSLPDDLKGMIQTAAVIGRSFPMQLLHDLGGRPSGAGPGTTGNRLETLFERQFLIKEPIGDQMGFAFRHVLIQEAVYSTLLRRDRQRLHDRVADVIANHTFLSGEDRTESLAHHYFHGSQPSLAIPHLIDAAENASRRSAAESAIRFYRRAVSLYSETPAQFDENYCRIHVGLGHALKFTGELEEAETFLQACLNYLHAQEAGLAFQIEILRELADIAQRRSQLQSGLDYLNQALVLAESEKGTDLWFTLVERLAWLHYRDGKVEEAVRIAQDAIRTIEEENLTLPYTHASLYNTMGGAAWQQGNLAEAVSYARGSLRMYQQAGYAWGTSVALCNLGVLHWSQGQWEDGIASYEKAAKLQSENGFTFEEAITLRNIGYLYTAQGEYADARKWFERTLEVCRRHHHASGIVNTFLALGVWAAEQELPEELGQFVQEIHKYSLDEEKEKLIQFHLLEGWLAVLEGDTQKAEQIAIQALADAENHSLYTEQTEARILLGRIYRYQNQMETAARYLRQVITSNLRVNPDKHSQALLELAQTYAAMAEASSTGRQAWRENALETARKAVEFSRGNRMIPRALKAEKIELLLQQSLEQPEQAQYPQPRLHAQPGQLALPQGERVQVAVIWLQMEPDENREDANRKDDEELFHITAELTTAISRIVYQNDGQPLRRQAGLTVVFGAPSAHEDDPFRALNTALQIAEFLDAHNASHSQAFRYALGLSYGVAVAGYLEPENQSGYFVTGEPVQWAEELAGAAGQGHIWVGPRLQRLTDATVEYARATDAEPHVTAEIARAEAKNAALLRKTSRAEWGGRGLPGVQVRMIGRDEVLQELMANCESLKRGRGGLVWLEGDAGIGKSRLLQEFVRTEQEQTRIWTGICTPQGTRQAFSLFASLFADIFNLHRTDSNEEKRVKLRFALQQWKPNHQNVAPYLELLCGIPLGLADAEQLRNLEPDQLRQQIFVACRALFVSILQTEPLVLILDDVHWMDPMSANLLLFLSYAVTSMPLLIVCAQRSGEGEENAEIIQQIRQLHEDHETVIELSKLTRAQAIHLLSELLPSADLTPTVRDFILQRSEGNPYYIEEFLRLLFEQEVIIKQGDLWIERPGQSLHSLATPNSLKALIRSRVDALPASLRQLLQLTAVIGRPFSVDLLNAIESQPDSERKLHLLAQRNLLIENSETHQWTFVHSLAQLVVYESMLKVRLRALHLQVAESLEEIWSDRLEAQAEELAHHYYEAGHTEAALRYLVIAGERLAARYANSEAIVYFKRAQALLDQQTTGSNDDLRWRVCGGLGDTYRFIGHYEKSAEALSHGLAVISPAKIRKDQTVGLYRRLGETAYRQGEPEKAYDYFRQALVTLEDPTNTEEMLEAARTLTGLANTHFRRGQLEKALESAKLGYSYAQQTGDRGELANSANVIGGIYYRVGERELALQHTIQAMNLREEIGYSWGVASTLGNLGILASETADWPSAIAYFDRSLALRQELGDVEGVVIMHNNLGWLRRLQGDLAESEEHFRASLATAEPLKLVFHAGTAWKSLAQIYVLRGDTTRARYALERCVEQANRVDAKDMQSDTYRIQAEIQLLEGQNQQAEESATRAAVLASETGSLILQASAWRVLAECRFSQGLYAQARAALEQASSVLAEEAENIEAGRLATLSARLYAQAEDLQSATNEFRRAREIFARVGAKYELEELDAIPHSSLLLAS